MLIPLYPMNALKTTDKNGNPVDPDPKLFVFTVTGYYVFFCLFMLAVALRQKHIMHYCGFLKSIFMKSMFYIFLASLALCDLTSFPNIIVGVALGGCTVLSWVGYCGKKDKDEVEAKE